MQQYEKQYTAALAAAVRAANPNWKNTGLKLNELEERSGNYYTKDGEDIKKLASAAVDKSGAVPGDYKAQLKQWICGMISEMSGKGWNNVADMELSILFQSGGLIDTKQSIIYSEDSEWIKDIMVSQSRQMYWMRFLQTRASHQWYPGNPARRKGWIYRYNPYTVFRRGA